MNSETIRNALNTYIPDWISSIQSTIQKTKSPTEKYEYFVNDFVVKNLSPRWLGESMYYDMSVPPEDLSGASVRELKNKWMTWEWNVTEILLDELEKKPEVTASILIGKKPIVDVMVMRTFPIEIDGREEYLDTVTITIWWKDVDGVPFEIPVDRVRVEYDEVSTDNIIVNITQLFPSGLARIVQNEEEEAGVLTRLLNRKLSNEEFIFGTSTHTAYLNDIGVTLQLFGRAVP